MTCGRSSSGYAGSDTKEILARAAEDRSLDFATDEDTPGPDPMARRFDHAGDPLDYADAQIALAQELRSKIIENMVDDGESWAKVRRAYNMLLNKQLGAASIASNWIGGSEVHRVVKGDGSGA